MYLKVSCPSSLLYSIYTGREAQWINQLIIPPILFSFTLQETAISSQNSRDAPHLKSSPG
jgi:hypothetical protein